MAGNMRMLWCLLVIFICTCVVHPTTSVEEETNTTNLEANDSGMSFKSRLNDFGYRLLVQMMDEEPAQERNLVLGTTSVIGMLAMTLLGTVGDTYNELGASLGFSQDVRLNIKHHEMLGSLLSTLSDNASHTRTLYADAVFVDKRERLRTAYKEYLQRVYKADAVPVDFHNGNESQEVINKWVSSHTEGKIKELVKRPLHPSTKLVLLSAHYFKGQWAKPFSVEYTNKMVFHKTNGEVMADMMANFGHLPYAYSKECHCHMIAVPYNETASMYILQPRKNKTLVQLLHEMSWSDIEKLSTELHNQSAVLRFPKMKLDFNANLKDSLESLGVRSIFDPKKANFGLMIDGSGEDLQLRLGDSNDVLNKLVNPGVYVDSIVHEVQINIDEYGTEAVAATAGLLARTAALFYADSPFLFFIRDEDTKLVTFSAIVNDPTE